MTTIQSHLTMVNLHRMPVATIFLICFNVVPFIIYGSNAEELKIIVSNYGLHVGVHTQPSEWFAALFSYSVVHTNLFHLVSNMIGLAFFGAMFERSFGISKLFAVYVICAICSALIFAGAQMFGNSGDVILVGSSGAVSGLVGVALVQRNKVAYYWLIAEALVMATGYFMAVPIGYIAHIAGILTGFAFANMLKINRSRRILAEPEPHRTKPLFVSEC